MDVDLAMGAPGSDIDDGFALALALADPQITVDLVTTVNGNTDVMTATALTLELLHRLGRPDIAVHRGAQVPLLRPQARFGRVPADVPIRPPQDTPAAVAMVEHVAAHPSELTLVAVGPLTNVALAMRLDPTFAASLKRLVVMGGVYDGHTHQAAMPGEFNIWSDPEAAQIVLAGAAHPWLVGLDVTTQVRLTRAEARQMQASDKAFESFAGRCSIAWIDHLTDTPPRPDDSCALHDPLAVASVIDSGLLTWSDAYVQVETGDRLRGATLADYLDSEPAPEGQPIGHTPNAHVARAVDVRGFTDLFGSRVRALP